MFGFEVTPFKATDITLAELRPEERATYEAVGLEHMAAELVTFETLGVAWTIKKDGLFIAATGAIPYMPTKGAIWQLPSIHVAKHMFSYSKIFKALIERELTSGKWTRLQTICLGDQLHERWMNFLGFKKEGVLECFDLEGRNHVIWARLSNGR